MEEEEEEDDDDVRDEVEEMRNELLSDEGGAIVQSNCSIFIGNDCSTRRVEDGGRDEECYDAGNDECDHLGQRRR